MARNAATPARPPGIGWQRGVGQRCAGQEGKVHLPAPARRSTALSAHQTDAGISALVGLASQSTSPSNSFRSLRNLSASRKTTRSNGINALFFGGQRRPFRRHRQPGVDTSGRTGECCPTRNRHPAAIATAFGASRAFHVGCRHLVGQVPRQAASSWPLHEDHARQGEHHHRHRLGPAQPDRRHRGG